MAGNSEEDAVSSEVNAFLLSKTKNNFGENFENIVLSTFRFTRPSWWTKEMNRFL